MPRVVRNANRAHYKYTPGQEWRSSVTGDEYIGPYFTIGGFFYSGYDAESRDSFPLVPFSIAKEAILYRNRFEDFNDKARVPKPFIPVIEKKQKAITRVFALDRLSGRFFEIKPITKKYYDESKPLRKRYQIEKIKFTLQGEGAIAKNIDAIAASSFPGRIKDLYLDPTQFISAEGILTSIDGEPLFSTLDAALAYGESNGLDGYHTHVYRGRVGYMAGETHSQFVVETVEYGGGSTGTDDSGDEDIDLDAGVDSGDYSSGGGSSGGSGGGGTGGGGGGGY